MPLLPDAGRRHEWLDKLASRLSEWIGNQGFPVPPFRISEGFPSTGQRSRVLAESRQDLSSNAFVILIRPDQDDPARLAAAMAHELVRIAVGPTDVRGFLFQHVASGIGLEGTRNASRSSPLFRDRLKPVLQALGPLPRSAGGDEAAPPAKQSARLIKVSCPSCGYVARVARKWLNEIGPPHCPHHGEMRVEQARRTTKPDRA